MDESMQKAWDELVKDSAEASDKYGDDELERYAARHPISPEAAYRELSQRAAQIRVAKKRKERVMTKSLAQFQDELFAVMAWRNDITDIEVRPIGDDLDADEIHISIVIGAVARVNFRASKSSFSYHPARLESKEEKEEKKEVKGRGWGDV